jgi:hypothetical protein
MNQSNTCTMNLAISLNYNMHNINLASIYSAMGEPDMVCKYLNKNKINNLLAFNALKYNPMFNNIRNEPEFQKVVKEMETSYRKHPDQVEIFYAKLVKSNKFNTTIILFNIN